MFRVRKRKAVEVMWVAVWVPVSVLVFAVFACTQFDWSSLSTPAHKTNISMPLVLSTDLAGTSHKVARDWRNNMTDGSFHSFEI